MFHRRALAGLTLMFMAAFSLGFLTDGGWRVGPTLATRGEVAKEAARVLNALQPLIRPWEAPRAGTTVFTDFPFPFGLPVEQVVGFGIMTGFPDGRFCPEKPMTRGEGVVTFSRLVQALEKSFFRKPPILPVRPKYQDIPEGHWLNGDLARLGGIGALRGFAGGKFLPEQPLRLLELRQLRTAFLEYFGENLFILSGTPPDLVLLPKGVFDRLSCFGWSYSLDGVEWNDVPENGRIPLAEKLGQSRLFFRHPDYQTIGPVEVRPGQLNFWLLLVRKDLKKFRDRLLAERQQEAGTEGTDRLGFHLQSLRVRLKKPAPVETPAPTTSKLETAAALRDRFVEEDAETSMASTPGKTTPELGRVSPPRSPYRWGGGPELETRAIPEAATAQVEASSVAARTERAISGEVAPSPAVEPEVSRVGGIVLDSLSGKGISGAVVLADRQSFATDQEGRFQFDVSAHSILDLTIYCEGYEPLNLRHRVDLRQREARFLLKPLFHGFDGFVTSFDTGEPIPGALVRLGEHRTRSGPDGKFFFTRVKPTFYQLSGQAQGFMEAIEFVHVAHQEGELHELKLKPIEKAWEKLDAPVSTKDHAINEALIDEPTDVKGW